VVLAAALMIGPLVLALFALRAGERDFERAVGVASLGAALFAVASTVEAYFAFQNFFGDELGANNALGYQLAAFVLVAPLGKAWLATIVMGALVTLALLAWRGRTPVLVATLVALAALVPTATQTHSPKLPGYELAVGATWLLHAGLAVLVGGAVLLVVLRGDGDRDGLLRRRYFTLAIVALPAAVVGGVARAWVAIADGGGVPASPTPAQQLTGDLVPPELSGALWVTTWRIDLLWLFAVALGVAFYFAGVRRLRRSGEPWQVRRTAMWMVGMLLLAWVSSGAINRYGEFLLSVQLLGALLLGLVIPLLLIAGRPVALALAAIKERTDGTRGVREYLTWLIETPIARAVTHPLVAAGVISASWWLVYFTGVLRFTLYDYVVSHVVSVWLLLAGCLLARSLVFRRSKFTRSVALVLVIASFAAFGYVIQTQTGLMVAEWFGAMGRTWGATPLDDQQLAGSVVWWVACIPLLVLAVAIALGARDTQSIPRPKRIAREEDAALAEYNAQLAALAQSRNRG
jgi:cytochrome c oxidase assembly factor CtaG